MIFKLKNKITTKHNLPEISSFARKVSLLIILTCAVVQAQPESKNAILETLSMDQMRLFRTVGVRGSFRMSNHDMKEAAMFSPRGPAECCLVIDQKW